MISTEYEIPPSGNAVQIRWDGRVAGLLFGLGAVVPMKAWETLAFALGWSRSWETPPIPGTEFDPAARLEDTVTAWDS